MSEREYGAAAVDTPRFTPAPALRLQRKCACGGSAPSGGECAECREKKQAVQRSGGGEELREAPPAVRETLSSAGEPLDEGTRREMQRRLGHDFRRVRVHRDDQAAASAQTVQARAYTVGRHVVFGAGEYAPTSSGGRALLAHELAHVVQQEGAPETRGSIPVEPADTPRERAAERVEKQLNGAAGGGPARTAVQRQGPPAPSMPSPTGQLGLTIDGKGRVTVTVSGPNAPVVGNPTIGIRRNPDGTYEMVFGGTRKTVAASEIPGLLRGALGAGGAGGKKPQKEWSVPTCEQLLAQNGFRYKTFSEYQGGQMLLSNPLPLTAELYNAILSLCPPAIPEAGPAPEPNDAPITTQTEDEAVV